MIQHSKLCAYFREHAEFTQRPWHWRHDGRGSVSNHRLLGCLLNRLFRRRSKKTSKLCVTCLCEGNSPATGEFPSQRASNAENVSIWWRHYACTQFCCALCDVLCTCRNCYENNIADKLIYLGRRRRMWYLRINVFLHSGRRPTGAKRPSAGCPECICNRPRPWSRPCVSDWCCGAVILLSRGEFGREKNKICYQRGGVSTFCYMPNLWYTIVILQHIFILHNNRCDRSYFVFNLGSFARNRECET